MPLSFSSSISFSFSGSSLESDVTSDDDDLNDSHEDNDLDKCLEDDDLDKSLEDNDLDEPIGDDDVDDSLDNDDVDEVLDRLTDGEDVVVRNLACFNGQNDGCLVVC